MQCLQRLLLDRLDFDRTDIGSLGRFEQGEGISGIGLVAPNVGANVLSWQQGHLNTAGAQLTSEVMRRSASFHDHAINGAVNKEALELSATQATVLDRTP